MKVPLLDLKAQYADIRDEIRAAIDEVCDAQYFILGPDVEAFERRMAEYCGVDHAVGVSSGTDALIAALMALNVGAGDAVITTPYTFFATAGSIVRVGATPVFVDIDPVTYNIDPEKVRKTLELPQDRLKDLKPRVLLPVHLYGQAADMDPLLDIAEEHGLTIIEDAAQAMGVEYPAKNGTRRVGSMGDIGCFSFFPSKNLGGFGDGGMVTTVDPEIAEKIRVLRDHGAKPRNYYQVVGGNFRLDALQAAVLNVKLNRLESWHERRRVNAERYCKAFEGSHVRVPGAVYKDREITNYHIYNQYVVRVADRDVVMERLKRAGIGSAVYYPVPLHLQECFRDLGYVEGDLPESEKAAKETLALPIYPELTEKMQEYVAQALLCG